MLYLLCHYMRYIIMSNQCNKCSGTGDYRGNGMILIDCPDCKGSGFYAVKETVSIDKRSKHYKTAIKDISKANPEMSLEDVEKLFEKTFKEQL
jgi:DnaJ-class molecular chaperone